MFPGQKPIVIAIDGPAGSGKGSIAAGLAGKLELEHLDTGAMYRALTWSMNKDRVDLTDATAVARYARGALLEFRTGLYDRFMAVQGRPVTEEDIRDSALNVLLPMVSKVPDVRTRMRYAQRSIITVAGIRTGGIVVEGRDITTTVAPDARVRMLVTASPEVRAQRRALQKGLDFEAVLADINTRDGADSRVSKHFLEASSGVHVLDTSDMDLEEAIAAALEHTRSLTNLQSQLV